MATESGFVRDTFEKVLRLKEILKFLNEDKSLREHLLLKGGMLLLQELRPGICMIGAICCLRVSLKNSVICLENAFYFI